MSKEAEPDEMRDYYDFSNGVRGKYAARYAEGVNVVLLDPDGAAVYPDDASVNEAPRALAAIARRQTAAAGHPHEQLPPDEATHGAATHACP